MTEQGDREVLSLSAILQEKLQSFASSNTQVREAILPDIITFVLADGNVNKDTLKELTNPEFQERFQRAIGMTLETPFETDGEELSPWDGGYAAVAIDLNGNILGADTNPQGEVYEQYGDNLFPYALSKALFRLHLKKASRAGGLDNANNFNYIKGLGFQQGETLFLGEEKVGPVTVGESTTFDAVIIGTSGCEPTKEYRTSLAPNMLQEGVVDFAAGHLDMVFAGITGTYLKTDIPKKMPEPHFLSQLKRAH